MTITSCVVSSAISVDMLKKKCQSKHICVLDKKTKTRTWGQTTAWKTASSSSGVKLYESKPSKKSWILRTPRRLRFFRGLMHPARSWAKDSREPIRTLLLLNVEQIHFHLVSCILRISWWGFSIRIRLKSSELFVNYRGAKTPHALVMHRIVLRISLKSLSTVYFSAFNIPPHAARPAFDNNCACQKTFFPLLYFCWF